MNENDIPDELKGVAGQYQKDIESIKEQVRAEDEHNEQTLKDIKNPKTAGFSLDNSEPVKTKDDDEKEDTTLLQFKTSSKFLDLIKQYEYNIKKNGKEEEEPVFYKPIELTAMKLSYTSHFPKGINVQLFDSLRRTYPAVDDWIDYDIFKRLDLSNGERTKFYHGRMTIDQAGQMSELKDQFFFDPYSDTLLVACTLLAIDNDDDMSNTRLRFEKDIRTVKKYFTVLKENYKKNINDILFGILEGRCGTYHMPIFIDFVHELIVGDKQSHKDHLKNHREEITAVLLLFSGIDSKILSDKSKIQLADIVKILAE